MHLVTTRSRPAALAAAVLLGLATLLGLSAAAATAAPATHAHAVTTAVAAGSSSPGIGGSDPESSQSTPARGASSPHGVDAFMAVVTDGGLPSLVAVGVAAAALLVVPCLVYLALGLLPARRRSADAA